MSDWEPDAHLVSAALDGRVQVKKLDAFDRAWVIAGLFRAGLTAEAIAEKCSCSLRLVFQIKAEPMTVAFLYVIDELEKRDAVILDQRAKISLLRSQLVTAEMDADRYKGRAYGRSLTGRR